MTSSSEQPKVCLCQGVCPVYQEGFKLAHNTCPLTGCQYDTRSRTHPAPTCDAKVCRSVINAHREEAATEAARKAREDVLDAIIVNLESRKKTAADIEKSPCTHTKMSQRFGVARLVLSETQEFVESLRSTTPHTGQEQPR